MGDKYISLFLWWDLRILIINCKYNPFDPWWNLLQERLDRPVFHDYLHLEVEQHRPAEPGE